MGRNCLHTENIPRRFFSLVEMLVVMVIIAILVAAGAGGYTVARRWMAQSKTEALLAKLKIAIESYKNDKGYYPLPNITTEITGAGSVSTADAPNFRLDVNVSDFTGSASGDQLEPRNNMSSFMDYAELRHEQSYKISGDPNVYYLKDGWNTPAEGENYGAIKYRCPGLINTTSFDLYSAGPDRRFAANPAVDKEDDIYVKF